MISGRVRQAAESEALRLAENYEGGFRTAWLHARIAERLGRNAPSPKQIGHFLALNAGTLGLARVDEDRWGRSQYPSIPTHGAPESDVR
jgi:hypothetical protein